MISEECVIVQVQLQICVTNVSMDNDLEAIDQALRPQITETYLDVTIRIRCPQVRLCNDDA